MEKIDIRQMRVLVLLVRYKSVSRVAELLEISQQGVSSHLKKLRDLFPAELFIRQSAGLQPTDYACELADKFEQILADIDGVFVAAPFDPASSERTFRVMANEYAQLAIIPKLASALRTQAPSIRLDVVDFQAELHLEALASGEVDLVIGFDAYLDPGLLRATLRRDHYCCVLRRDSRYLPDNAPQDMAAIPFVQFANSVGNFEGQMNPQQVANAAVATLPCYTSLQAFMSVNDVAACIPSAIATLGDFRVLELAGAPQPFEVVVGRHRKSQGNLAIEWLAEVIKSVCDLAMPR
ncbi:LysR family transcriptional regulator [Aeromonas veronii]|uniref:LysR family transcriptional regulator n=1 Tax=Aeromonas veronii TaxID=654 RepID=UPI000955DF67|nr:LysR family transcriptional regulator [Aeromonas veronii]SIQ66672.1 transcriptional regulator, LysR family [Aeromonas veronii]